MPSYYFTPIVVKRYRSNLKKNEFLHGLRNRTREPFFDNRSDRRLDRDESRMFANEYDNFIFLSPEDAFRTRWVVFKTMLYLQEKEGSLKITTFSYPSGLGGLFYYGFGLVLSFYLAISALLAEGRWHLLSVFLGFYVAAVISSNPDFKKQNDLVKAVTDKFRPN